jgi:hypothetical protein
MNTQVCIKNLINKYDKDDITPLLKEARGSILS